MQGISETMLAVLRNAQEIGPISCEAGQHVRVGDAEPWTRIKLAQHQLDVPDGLLRFECTVPGCSEEREYVAPGDWCATHWRQWWNLGGREEEAPSWVAAEGRHASRVTFRYNLTDGELSIPKGTEVTPVLERIRVHVWIGEQSGWVWRPDLQITCEQAGCQEEAVTYDPKWLCKEHWLSYEGPLDPCPGMLGEWDAAGKIDIGTDDEEWVRAQLDETDEPPEGTLMRIVRMQGQIAIVEVA